MSLIKEKTLKNLLSLSKISIQVTGAKKMNIILDYTLCIYFLFYF